MGFQPRKITRGVPYRRVSTAEQDLSLHAQDEAIRAWAKRQGVAVLLDPFTDEDVSGGLAIDKRPALIAALSVLEPGDALVVSKRDRLGRDVMIVGMIESLVNRKGACVVSAAGEGTDDDDPASILLRQILDVFAAYERLVIKVRTRSGLAVLRKQGRRSGTTPIGRAVVDDGGRSKTSNAPNGLGDCPAELAAVRQMVDLAAAGLSPRAIGRELVRLGFPPRPPRGWHPNLVKAILRDCRARSIGDACRRFAGSATPQAIERIAELHVAGHKPKAIARQILLDGHLPPLPTSWHHTTIRKVLKRQGLDAQAGRATP